SGPSTTATGKASGGRLRKASPRMAVRRIGNMNTQNTASGSRVSSRMRASVSSASGPRTRYAAVGLAIPQPPSRQVHEDVFERGVVRREMHRVGAAFREGREQRGNGPMHFPDGEAPMHAVMRHALH